MLSLPFIAGLLGIIALGWFWHDSLGVRERANRAAQDACERMQLQFLDGTVAFAGLKLMRVAGRMSLRRTYVFDYTASSIERRQGFVMFIGARLESLGFAPHEHQLQPTTGQTAARLDNATLPLEQRASEAANDNVLDLNEWRARRQQLSAAKEKQSNDTWQ